MKTAGARIREEPSASQIDRLLARMVNQVVGIDRSPPSELA